MSKRKGGYVSGQRGTKKQRGINNQLKKLVDTAVNMRVSGLVGLEKKYHDFLFEDAIIPESLTSSALAFYNAESSTAFNSITAIPAGDGHYQREGNEITLDSLYIKGKVYTVSETTGGGYLPQTVRVMVVMDKQNNSSGSPGIADILDTSPALVPTFDHSAVFCYRNLENIDRFAILHDETFDLNSFANPWWDGTSKQTNAATKMINIQIKKGIKGQKVHYMGASQSNGNQTSNNIFLFMIVDDNNTGGTEPLAKFRGVGRLRWYG